MKILKDICKARGFGVKYLQFLLATLVLTVSVLQGMTVCFCDSEPKSCGDEHCQSSHKHGCHDSAASDADQSINHDCAHLDFAAIDALALSGNLDPVLTSVLNSLFFNFIQVADPNSAAIFVIKYSRGQRSQGPPPQLIYISNSVQVLC